MEYLNQLVEIPNVLGITSSLKVLEPVAISGLFHFANFIAPGQVTVDIPAFSPLDEIVKAGMIVATTCLLLVLGAYYLFSYLFLDSSTYIQDIAVFNNFQPEWKIGAQEWLNRASKDFGISQESVEFCKKVLNNSGVGEYTHFPPGISTYPPDLSIAAARYEAEVVMFDCVDQLLKRNNVKPSEVDILVVNCSIFNPTPSLAAMIINHYKMREDIIVYNLSGLGCSASPIAVQLASDLIQGLSKRNAVAIVVSTENITQNIYLGSEKSMLVTNSLFRMGGAAVMLTKARNGWGNRPAPQYKINHIVRIHMGADDEAYKAVYQDADKEMRIGVRLDKSLMSVAAKGLTKNLTVLGPRILPVWEMVRYGFQLVKSKWLKSRGEEINSDSKQTNGELKQSKPAPLVPNFKTAVDYICIHAGGRAVIDAIGKALDLTEEDCKPSRNVLYKYGNVSSACIWYEVREVEQLHEVKKGQKLMLIALGSGFKVNTMVIQKV